MDIKGKTDGSGLMVLTPTKTEIKQAEATRTLMQLIALGTPNPTQKDLHERALECADGLDFVLAELNGEAKPKDAEATETTQ